MHYIYPAAVCQQGSIQLLCVACSLGGQTHQLAMADMQSSHKELVVIVIYLNPKASTCTSVGSGKETLTSKHMYAKIYDTCG